MFTVNYFLCPNRLIVLHCYSNGKLVKFNPIYRGGGGGGHYGPSLKIAHISGIFYRRCLHFFYFSGFGLTSNLKKILEHLSQQLFLWLFEILASRFMLSKNSAGLCICIKMQTIKW